MDNTFAEVDWGPRVGPQDVGVSLGNNNSLDFDTLLTTFDMGDAFEWTYTGQGEDGTHFNRIKLENQNLNVYYGAPNSYYDPLVVGNVVNGNLLVDGSYYLHGGGTIQVAGVTGTWPDGKGMHYNVRYSNSSILKNSGLTSDIFDDYEKTSIVDALCDVIRRLKQAFPGQGF
jgi:hypothetical protein